MNDLDPIQCIDPILENKIVDSFYYLHTYITYTHTHTHIYIAFVIRKKGIILKKGKENERQKFTPNQERLCKWAILIN